MFVTLEFDHHTCDLYIPDGYITNLNEVYLRFFDWIIEQPECMIGSGKSCCIAYNEIHFERYINDVVLNDSSEKAYVLKNNTKMVKKIKHKLKF